MNFSSKSFILWMACSLLLVHSVWSQRPFVPLNPSALQETEAVLYSKEDIQLHTAIKPYNTFEVGHVMDSIHQGKRFGKDIDKKFKRWLYNAFLNDHFLEVKDKNDKYSLILNPLLDIRAGTSTDLDALPYNNTRGIQIMGRIGKTMTFYTDVYENQARFPNYVNQFVNEQLVVPGQGFPKEFDPLTSSGTAFDFSYVNGHVTFQPNEFFNFEFGNGKNFIGEGHRSLLMSDVGFNYPYLKIRTSFWKLNYVNLYAQMRDIRGTSYSDATFDKKYVVSHYLSINATKKFNIGLFETIVYQDSTQTLDLSYLNPFILYRPIEFAIGSRSGNVLMGFNMSYKVRPKQIIYSQIMIDEFKFDEVFKGDGWWANKFAIQLGVKSYDSFVPGLKLQTELNFARPYTYSHRTSGRSFGHYNQPLAHILGANFIESVSIIGYQKGRWFGNMEIMYALQGLDDETTNYGSDVFLSYDTRENNYGNETLQGIKSRTFYTDLRLGYIINPRTNLRAELGLTYRSFNPELETATLQKSNTAYIHFGITTALNNKYYDF